MPYIKSDDAINEVVTLRKHSANDEEKIAYSLVYKKLRELPTADVVEVCRCKDCLHAEEFEKHCDINRNAYRHCNLWRGDETKNVWHKYGKYYRDYSIVELDGFCSEGARKDD